MEAWFTWGGIALCLFAIWAIARNDLVRLQRRSRRVVARVVGHRESWENSSRSYAPIYAFEAEGNHHEVVDMVHSTTPHPIMGTMCELAYPEGRPDLARPLRPLMWLAIYALLLALPALLFAHWMAWIA